MSSKLERLLNMVAALLDTPRPLTAEEIRSRVGGYPESQVSFRRAFERDKDDLRSMGVPIVVEPVPGVDPPVDGYRIHRESYAGPDLAMTPDELAALHLASTLVDVEGLDDEAFWKLGGKSTTTGPSDAVVNLRASPNLGPLLAAAGSDRWVTFTYRDEDRLVLPQRISFVRGHWYVGAYDAIRADSRLFRLDRITGPIAATTGPDLAGPPPPPDPVGRSWELGDDEPILARFRVDADRASWALHEVGTDALLRRHDDGAVELEVAVRNRDGFRSFVLSFLDHAEVLSPTELRQDVIDWLEAMVAPSTMTRP